MSLASEPFAATSCLTVSESYNAAQDARADSTLAERASFCFINSDTLISDCPNFLERTAKLASGSSIAALRLAVSRVVRSSSPSTSFSSFDAPFTSSLLDAPAIAFQSTTPDKNFKNSVSNLSYRMRLHFAPTCKKDVSVRRIIADEWLGAAQAVNCASGSESDQSPVRQRRQCQAFRPAQGLNAP
jgi:hypothetical protein